MKNFTMVTFCAFLTLFSLLPRACWAAGGFQNWDPRVGDDIEFGITSLVVGLEEDAPWAFESGYNGAYWFDKDYSAGQTFTVASDRLLQSVSARVSIQSGASGQFEIAIYEFDQASQSTTDRLALITGDAASYQYSLSSVPVSTFDLSGFNVTLVAGQTYMLTFRGTESSEGQFLLQSATDIYGGGCAYLGTYNASGPDLTGTWMPKRAGRIISGKLFIENIGSEPVAERFTIALYLSDDGITPGSLLFSKRKSVRRILQQRTFRVRFRSFSDTYVIAVIDSGNSIAETDENNNSIVLQSPANP